MAWALKERQGRKAPFFGEDVEGDYAGRQLLHWGGSQEAGTLPGARERRADIQSGIVGIGS